MTQMDMDPFFRQLEIVPGIETPLTWDTREIVLRMAIAGIDFDGFTYGAVKPEYTQLQREIMTRVRDEHLRAVAYLAELLLDEQMDPTDLPTLKRAQARVYSELRSARALYIGLPMTATMAEVLAAELQRPDRPVSHLEPRHLTMTELRRLRDSRRGTYVPLIPGEW